VAAAKSGIKRIVKSGISGRAISIGGISGRQHQAASASSHIGSRIMHRHESSITISIIIMK